MGKKIITSKDWVDVKDDLPDYGDHVLTQCPGMGENGETMIIVAKLMYDDEWYSGFPYDQPVKPIKWCYSLNTIDIYFKDHIK